MKINSSVTPSVLFLVLLPPLVLCASFLLTGCEKWRVDAQVRELCEKDGGIKVYEIVKLPADKFDKFGQINFYDPTKGENTLGPQFIFKEERRNYRTGSPQMSRIQFKVLRRSDGKLLGETVLYGRGGGDMPGPWHDSSFHCPDPNIAGEIALLKAIFVLSKGDDK